MFGDKSDRSFFDFASSFSFFRYIVSLENILKMILELVQKLVDFYSSKEQAYLAQIADLQTQLATALGNDAADAEAIAAAQAAAAAAQIAADEALASVAPLQALADQDVVDDAAAAEDFAAASALVDSIVAPVVEEPPVEEPVVE